MKLAIAVVLLCGMAMGQTLGDLQQDNTITAKPTKAKPAKRCAFDLKPQTILDTRPTKPKPASEMFPQPGPYAATYLTSAYVPMRTVCPYERAIELFGEERVEFKEIRPASPCTMACPDKIIRRVLVDGESVYEERP